MFLSFSDVNEITEVSQINILCTYASFSLSLSLSLSLPPSLSLSFPLPPLLTAESEEDVLPMQVKHYKEREDIPLIKLIIILLTLTTHTYINAYKHPLQIRVLRM